MKLEVNPFQYEAANNLPDHAIVDYYIDDFNYSRFIQSQRNVFLIGERGSGKTMTLLYNKWELQKLRAERKGKKPDLSMIGIYVPCNTPLTHKPEYQLLDQFLAEVLAEHFLVLTIAYGVVDTLAKVDDLLQGVDQNALFEETEFLLGAELPRNMSFFNSFRIFVQREIRRTQLATNTPEQGAFYDNTLSFVSMLAPMFDLCVRHISKLAETHFSIMVDDAHSLSTYQIKVLNSWIAYRDHSRFSFKVAAAKSGHMSKATSFGGQILERHDYTTVDLEAPLHNKHSRFYELAKLIVARRLRKAGVDVSPEEFFPLSKTMEAQLAESRAQVVKVAVQKYGTSTSKEASDYIYKQARPHYFRSRPPRANRPPYSGFETLAFLSTGVIRNLLEPCFWMFDRVVSGMDDRPIDQVKFIPSVIQSEVIRASSERTWTWLKEEIAQDIEGCSTDDGRRAYQLLDGLASLFRDRLLGDSSEPGATSFTLSGKGSTHGADLKRVIDVLRKAQLVYVRNGPAKEAGRLEQYYVPNRILWPARGLDPHGQHARVSILVDELWMAAEHGQVPKSDGALDGEITKRQGGLFDDEDG